MGWLIGLEPTAFWATRKGGARSEPECRRHPATYTQPQEGDWLVFQPISAQHPLSPDFFF